MKRLFFILLIFGFFSQSCKDELTDNEELTKYVNEWVHDNMSAVYYWNTTLPVYKSNIGDPKVYFKTLKNKEDRFSSIFESYTTISNELKGISAFEAGIKFQLYKESATSDNVYAVVRYVKKGTSAATLGVKRGDIIRKINDKLMTLSNYKEVINYLYDSAPTVSITLSTLVDKVFVDKSTLSIIKITGYKEHPLFLDTIYTIQNKKIGYIVYHFFANDPGDKTMQYDLAINNAFGRFKSANITELIVDYRYNSGGAMSSAINFSSMMVPNLASDKVFSYTEYNNNYTEYFNSEEYKKKYSDNPFVDNFATTIDLPAPKTEKFPIQNVGDKLKRVFFLTGGNTASASEMVINGVMPFLPCVLIGDTTVGKNVGSILINDEKNVKNQWAILPIILKYFNKDKKSDFTMGFAPNFFVNDDLTQQLGDTREALLAKAISQITGIQTAPSNTAKVFNSLQHSPINFNRRHNDLIVNSKPYLNHTFKFKNK